MGGLEHLVSGDHLAVKIAVASRKLSETDWWAEVWQLLELVRKAEAREMADKARDTELRGSMIRALQSQVPFSLLSICSAAADRRPPIPAAPSHP